MSASMPDDVRARLAERFPQVVPAEGDLDSDGVIVPAGTHVEFARFLKEELGFTLYVTVVGSHWPDKAQVDEDSDDEPYTYEVATVLRRPTKGDSPEVWWRVRTMERVPTLYPLFAGADWQEREQYDLVGVVFTGHPDMRRLMMPEDWEGHPLHKEYAIDTPHPPWR